MKTYRFSHYSLHPQDETTPKLREITNAAGTDLVHFVEDQNGVLLPCHEGDHFVVDRYGNIEKAARTAGTWDAVGAN